MSLDESVDLLHQMLERLVQRTPYAEVMAERQSGLRARLDRRSRNLSERPRLEGAVFRVWDGDHWAECATSGLDQRELEDSLEGLLPRLGREGKSGPPPGRLPEGVGSFKTDTHRAPESLSFEDRMDWLRSAHSWAMSTGAVVETFVSLDEVTEERLFLSSSGARLSQRLVGVVARVLAVAAEGGRSEQDYLSEGFRGGYEVLDRIDEPAVREIARGAKAMLGAHKPPLGLSTVVLDPSTTGTFAHESFGHGAEADQVLRGRSYLAPLFGQQLGPEFLTLVDDGTLPRGWGSIGFDDEGTVAHRTVLVDHGRFVGYLHDRETAQVLGGSPTGNARRSDFLSRVFARMTNTFVEPGDWTREELLHEARDGVLLEKCVSGIEDPLGGNMGLQVLRGRLLRAGEPGPLVRGMALSGKVLEFLRSIRGVSRKEDFALDPGTCGKGSTDYLPVSSGGPYLLGEVVLGEA